MNIKKKKEKYSKPEYKLVEHMTFMFDGLKKKKYKHPCKQCSSCHGCR